MAHFRVASLGSGSAGNSLLLQAGDTNLLLDCGFTLKETVARLEHLGVSIHKINAVVITHEHSDHTKGVGPIARKIGLPIWMTHGTFAACRDKKLPGLRFFHAHQKFFIGDIELDPFPTPHDAAESCQFVFSHGGFRFACVTDLGACTPHVKQKLQGVDGILVESNYDIDMLNNGPYPPSLRSRITSNYGHLGNLQAGVLLQEIDHTGLSTILLGHLSERNNTAEHAFGTVSAHISRPDRITVLEQHAASRWFDVNGADAARGQRLNTEVESADLEVTEA